MHDSDQNDAATATVASSAPKWPPARGDVTRHLPRREPTVIDSFYEQARRTPDATAVLHEASRLSYREAAARAAALAGHLRSALGVQADSLVALHVERSIEMVIGILAVLETGAAYLPLDPAGPRERAAYALRHARPHAILTRDEAIAAWAGSEIPTAIFGAERQNLDGEPAGRARAVPGDSLAYVIYTSGSTGAPKGVMIPHAALTNQLRWLRDTFPLGPGDVVLQKTPFTFDASIWEILHPLLCGATLAIARPQGHKDPRYLVEAIKAYGVTTLQLVPSMLRLVLQQPGIRECTTLRNLFSGGEVLTADLRDRVFAELNADLHNLYGPTETCIQSLAYSCGADDRRAYVPLGRAVRDTQVYVLDESLVPVAAGAAGELYIGGAGLARGYLRQPGLTAERFMANPFGPPGSRLYRTGDVVRRALDGHLEFLGRADRQLKLAGHRIEPVEVETALSAHPCVREAAVVAASEPGATRLVAYVVTTGDASPDELREFLRPRLPEAAIPTTFAAIAEIPRLDNGKIDYRALPAVARRAPGGPPARAATRAEAVLVEICESILGITGIRVDDDFFDLGGDSIAFIEAIARANEKLGTSVGVEVISFGATIESIAPHFDRTLQERTAEDATSCR